MNWLIIAIVVLALLLVLKIFQLKHRALVIVLVGLFLFFYITFSIVAKNHNLDLASPSGVFQAGKVYFSWFGSALSNMKSITANAIKMDWRNSSSSLVKTAEGIMRG